MPLDFAEAICESETLLLEAAAGVFLDAGVVAMELPAGAAAGAAAGDAMGALPDEDELADAGALAFDDLLLLFIALESEGAAIEVLAEAGGAAVPASAFALFLLLFFFEAVEAGAAASVELAPALLPCAALASDFLLFLDVFEDVLLAEDSLAPAADPVWSALAVDFLLFLEVLVGLLEELLAADWSSDAAAAFLDFFVVFFVELVVWPAAWSCVPL